MGNYRCCLFFTRKFKTAEAEAPDDVKEEFRKYADGGTHMSAEQLQQFLIKAQGHQDGGVGGDGDAEQIVNRVMQRHPIKKFARNNGLTLDDFYFYLFSVDLNPPMDNQVRVQDMTAPLSHYFIYTGHNSYLTGNQLSSDCSDVPIIKSLNRGVRVVELDLWPNSEEDEVHVLHGRTLTTPVELIKCLRSIKEHAFSASPYPVIITFEDHLTTDLRAKVAEMVVQTFGDMLFVPEVECLQEFPSPEELKYKIIISTKPPKEYLKAKKRTKSKNSKSRKEKDSDDDEWGKEPAELTAEHEDGEKSDSLSSESEDEDEDSGHDMNSSEPSEYERLIAIHAGKPKGGLKAALKIEPNKVKRLSLSEQALENAATSNGKDVIRFTQKNILRIYPKGTRFTPSNYKPLIGWMHGAQMVAFNMQGYGRSLWLMHGMFRANGGCGYVKKPQFLMTQGPDGEVKFDPKATLPVKKTLKIKIYMGDGWHMDFKQTHFDLYSPPDFYARIGISGAPVDEIMKKTRTIEDCWTPVWNEEFTFKLTVPELALLRVEVHEYDMSEKDDFGGQTCLPVAELKPGIRAVPLFNRKGEKYKSVRLLMRF
ncbi:LOW QUALITY PROTEIN: phosphoinositide phospholipase C 4-like, partial [Rutidosis leptorrhynchoides]|uniref:LOW QUALITY PROTEIN: phosphoinositide phospholipase C 4-like n=1 Tax=Rutidosis leptorrhynchoides TaxID=125765 RepID=UPI003A98F611